MKKHIFLWVFLLIISTFCFSQNKGFFSVGLNGGIIIPSSKLKSDYKLGDFGPVGALEVGYRVVKEIELVGNFVYSNLKIKDENLTDTKFYYIEGTVGGRLIGYSGKGRLFAEVCIGDFTFNAKWTYHMLLYSGVYLDTTISKSESNPGINFGAGGKYSFSKNWDFIFKIKYNRIFRKGPYADYFSFNLGVNYLFR